MKKPGWMMLLFLIALFACNDAPRDTLPPDGPSPIYVAQIQRTSFGIPHVRAADEKGLGYGLGFAFAQDNACVLAEEVVTVRGERSRYFGPDATYDPSGDGHEAVNLQSDVYFTIHNEVSLVAAAWAAQPAEVQDLVLGYAHGFNRYLRDAAPRLPDACRGQPWVREITELDVMRVMRRFAVEASGEQFFDAMFAAQPPGATTAAVLPPARGKALATALERRFRPSLGSNGIALGRDATASQAGMLLAAPHFPWNGAFRFYELHLTIPGKVDVFGATAAGLPVVGIGHNADIAWTHTVNTSRHFTFHQLTLDPDDATRYIVDGQSKPLTAIDVAVQVRGATGEITPVTHRVWSSELGPIVVLPGFLDWTARTAFAFGDANADNTRFLATWWAINKARSLAELRAALETTLGIPWINTVAVDAGGTAYLGDVTAVPNLPDGAAGSCIPDGFGPLAATGLVVLDGSTARCRWKASPGTPGPGLVPAAGLPAITRTDFVQNSNGSAWLSNPAAPLTGYPEIVSRDGIPQNERTRQGLAQLTGELAAGRRFTSQSLLEFAFSNRAFHATTLLDDLRQLCAASSDLAIATSCSVLVDWDGTANLASVGWPLFKAWRHTLDAAAERSGLDYWTVPFDPADPIGTPRGLRIADANVAAAARNALVDATAALASAGLDITRPWGELQRAVRGGRQIAIHGGGGDRFNDGGDEIYNTINSRLIGDRFEPYYGSSLILAISFEGGAPVAHGLLTYSQSSDPASPHHADQTERFSRKDWIALPFTQAAIASDPELTVEQVAE